MSDGSVEWTDDGRCRGVRRRGRRSRRGRGRRRGRAASTWVWGSCGWGV